MVERAQPSAFDEFKLLQRGEVLELEVVQIKLEIGPALHVTAVLVSD